MIPESATEESIKPVLDLLLPYTRYTLEGAGVADPAKQINAFGWSDRIHELIQLCKDTDTCAVYTQEVTDRITTEYAVGLETVVNAVHRRWEKEAAF